MEKLRTIRDIHNALNNISHDQVKIISYMAVKRGKNPSNLSKNDYRDLLNEEANFVMAKSSDDRNEIEYTRAYACQLAKVAANIV